MMKPTTRSKATQTCVTQQTYNAAKPAPAVTPTATHDDIARRAHEIYIKKGCPQGQCEHNWLQAEQELRHHSPAAPPRQR
jgi:hypothetical protein